MGARELRLSWRPLPGHLSGPYARKSPLSDIRGEILPEQLRSVARLSSAVFFFLMALLWSDVDFFFKLRPSCRGNQVESG